MNVYNNHVSLQLIPIHESINNIYGNNYLKYLMWYTEHRIPTINTPSGQPIYANEDFTGSAVWSCYVRMTDRT